MIGYCRFCGQAMEVTAETQEDADAIASRCCECTRSKAVAEAEAQISSAKQNVIELFGEGALNYGFAPVEDEIVMEALFGAVELIGNLRIKSISFRITNTESGSISLSSSGKIEVRRNESRKVKVETV